MAAIIYSDDNERLFKEAGENNKNLNLESGESKKPNLVDDLCDFFKNKIRGLSNRKAMNDLDESFLEKLNFTESELAVIKELFPKGIKQSHLRQGSRLGDCYFVSALHAIKNHPLALKIISNMIKKDKNKWNVTFPCKPNPVVIDPAKDNLNWQMVLDRRDGRHVKKEAVEGQLGDVILERAFGKLRKEIKGKSDATFYAIEGGFSLEVFKTFLKDIIEKEYFEGDFNSYKSLAVQKKTDAVARLLEKYAENPKNFILTAATPLHHPTPYFEDRRKDIAGRKGKVEFESEKIYYMDPKKRFVQQHSYAIKAVDAKNKIITLVNPWDTKNLEYKINFNEFVSYFMLLEGVELDHDKIRDKFGKINFIEKDYANAVSGERLMPLIEYKFSINRNQVFLYLGKSVQATCYLLNNNEMFIQDAKGRGKFGYTLRKGEEIILGRNTELNFPNTVSWLHAKIKYLGNGEAIVADLNSTNGTRIEFQGV